jgi:hypothetical protein
MVKIEQASFLKRVLLDFTQQQNRSSYLVKKIGLHEKLQMKKIAQFSKTSFNVIIMYYHL